MVGPSQALRFATPGAGAVVVSTRRVARIGFIAGARRPRELALLEVNQEEGDRGRGHAGDAGGLTQGVRASGAQLLTYLRGQPPYPPVVDVLGQRRGLVAPGARNLVALPFDVAVILRLDLHLLGNLGITHPRPRPTHLHQGRIIDFGSTQQIERGVFAFQSAAEPPLRFFP